MRNRADLTEMSAELISTGALAVPSQYTENGLSLNISMTLALKGPGSGTFSAASPVTGKAMSTASAAVMVLRFFLLNKITNPLIVIFWQRHAEATLR